MLALVVSVNIIAKRKCWSLSLHIEIAVKDRCVTNECIAAKWFVFAIYTHTEYIWYIWSVKVHNSHIQLCDSVACVIPALDFMRKGFVDTSTDPEENRSNPFKWKVCSVNTVHTMTTESEQKCLRWLRWFGCDGTRGNIYWEIDWITSTVALPAATHTIYRWRAQDKSTNSKATVDNLKKGYIVNLGR